MNKDELRPPRLLHHLHNAMFLVGRKFWTPDIGEALDMFLRDWAKDKGDIHNIIKRSSKKLPHIVLFDSPSEIGAKINPHTWFGDDEPVLTISRSYPDIPQEDIQVALEPLLYPAKLITGKYVVYQHTIFNLEKNSELNSTMIKRMPKPSYHNTTKGMYFGITRQEWTVRLNQHISAASCGSPYLFHRAIRGKINSPSTHTIMSWDLSFEDAMNLEEELVAKHSLYPRGLNMIPGGFAGIQYLAEHGFKAQQHKGWQKMWENRERTIAKFTSHCVRTGRPNPLIAANWKNDDYALSVILNNKRNFTAEAVHMIRSLHATGFGPTDIATRMMVNVGRIHRLLRDCTYERVR